MTVPINFTVIDSAGGRHADLVAERIREGAAELLSRQLQRFAAPDGAGAR